MLMSLIKYELKATYKIFFLFYALVLFFGFLNVFFINSVSDFSFLPIEAQNNNFLENASALFLIIYLLLVFIVGIMTVFIIIYRFYKNIFGDTGYLMNTLPVSSYKLIISKLVTAFIWGTVGFGVCLFSALLLVASKGNGIGNIFALFFDILKDIFRWDRFFRYAFYLTYAIVWQISNIMIVYCSIAFGQMFNNHKKIIAFLFFIGFNFVVGIFSRTLYNCLGICDAFKYSNAMTRFDANLSFEMVIGVLVFAATFIYTNWIIKNKLNIE